MVVKEATGPTDMMKVWQPMLCACLMQIVNGPTHQSGNRSKLTIILMRQTTASRYCQKGQKNEKRLKKHSLVSKNKIRCQ